MIYDIQLSDAALRDLDSAYRYISISLMNKKAADDLLSKAESLMRLLSEYPERFSLVNDPVLRSWGIRAAKVDNYMIFYLTHENSKKIDIVRFLYFRRNWASILTKSSGPEDCIE